MTYNAPTNLDLSGCNFSADGGKTSVTGASIVQTQTTQAASIASAAQDASDAKTTAATANQTANQAETDAQTALTTANAALPISKNVLGDDAMTNWDQFPVMKTGTIALGNGCFSGTMYGQGTQQSWNDPPGVGCTSFLNINPGVRGGFRFYEIGTGTKPENGTLPDTNAWGLCVDTSWGYMTLGRTGQTATQWIGRANSNNWQILSFYTASTSYNIGGDITNVRSGDAQIIARNGDGTGYTAEITIAAASLTSYDDGKTDIGSATNRFNNLYLAGTVNQTSDASEKTVIGKVTDSTYADSAKLLALYEKLTPIVYQYNSAISEKGATNARYHIGNIAQDVKAAFTAVGLDASKWSIWSEEALTEQVQTPVVTKKTVPSIDENGNSTTKEIEETTYTYETKPILDASGNPRTRQALNYIDLLMLYTACAQSAIDNQQTALTALTSRVSALETKVGGTA